MDVSLTAVTANRFLGRALRRLVSPLDELKSLLSGVRVEGWKFRILQLALVDEPEMRVTVQRTPRGSQLLQIAAGLPKDLTFKDEDDPRLLAAIAEQLLRALDQAGLPDEARAEAGRRIGIWKNAIYAQLGRTPKQ
jgi:hypothetical protein